MNNSENATYQNLWDAAKAEIITLNEHTTESKAKIQLSKHLFQF